MSPTQTIVCRHCLALRWVEDWRETREEMMSIVLGPCGHVLERTARLEWAIPTRSRSVQMRLVPGRPARASIVTS